jgi:hypothetical protein
MAVFLDVVMRVGIAVLFIAINSILIQFVSSKLNLDEEGFDNSTTIALVLGVLIFVVSYMPRWKGIFMFIGGTVLPLILIKELYKINWKKTFHFWIEWFILYILVLLVLSLALALLV